MTQKIYLYPIDAPLVKAKLDFIMEAIDMGDIEDEDFEDNDLAMLEEETEDVVEENNE